MHEMKKYSLLILLPAMLLLSCRKSNNAPSSLPASFTGCHVSTITQTFPGSTSTITSFTYNSDGSVATIKSQSPPDNDIFVKTFIYKPGIIIINTTDNSLPYSRDSLLTDAQNRVTYINHYDYNGSPQPNLIYDIFQYDTSGNIVTASVTYHNYSQISSAVYEWKNGDLQWNTSGSDFYSYNYDTTNYNTASVTTDVGNFLNYGRGILANVHWLSQSYLDSQLVYTYTNSTDSAGKITSIRQADATNTYFTTTNITYDCR